MPTTPNFGFPYPGLSDAPNGPAQIQALAEAVDTTLATGLANVTMQVFTSSSSWTRPTGCKMVVVEVVGAGGGGGGCAAGDGSNGAVAAGGGGGGYARKLFVASALASSETVTIGSAGTGGAAGNNAGNAGNASTFATGKAYVVTGSGGAGGAGGALSGGFLTALGGAGGSHSGGDFGVVGGPGKNGILAGGIPICLQYGGDTILGFGARSNVDATGTTGQSYGGGGGGGLCSVGSTTARAGGPGTTGIIVVTNYIV